MVESISEGTLKQWNNQVGDFVEQNEEIATIETDKIDVAVNAPEAGTIKQFLTNEGDTVVVGQDFVLIEVAGTPPFGGDKPAPSEPKESAKEPAPEKEAQPPKALEPKPEESKPGPAAPKETAAPKQETRPTQISKDGPAPLGNREERRVKMNRMRLRIAERLKQSPNTAASLITFNEVDMSALMDFRKAYKDEILKKTGVKLGFVSAFSVLAFLPCAIFQSLTL